MSTKTLVRRYLRAAIAAESPDAVNAICWGAGSLAETTGLVARRYG